MRLTTLGATTFVAAATLLTPLGASAKPAGKKAVMKHVLVVSVTKGFRHDSVELAAETIQKLGADSKSWDTDFVKTGEEMQTKMTAEALKKYDAVIFANTTGILPLPDPQGFLNYVKSGHGFAAMHSGSDTFHQFPGDEKNAVSSYVKMLGGEFMTHHAQSQNGAVIVDGNFVGNRKLKPTLGKSDAETSVDAKKGSWVRDGRWFTFDEIYLLKNVDRANMHVLVKLDAYPADGSPDAGKPIEQMISWVKPYGKGKVFYTVLGHREEVWRDPLYQSHILGGIRFVLGLDKGSMAPN